jgi:NADH-quinone oxidoreductase subunit J
MTFLDWISEPVNWVFLALGVATLVSAFRVVTSQNLIHAALFLVGTLGGVAGLFVLLSAEFVALVIVLVYLGAVIVLFLFGIMITRPPTGLDVGLDNDRRLPAALVALVLFGVLASASLMAFGSDPVSEIGTATDTSVIATSLLGRFVVPFEVVGFILLAALIGGITLARRDLTPLEEEERRAV